MAFSTGPQALQGPELPEISTETLGFNALQSNTYLKILPNDWPADSLPPPTANLLSIASRKGLLAAASPDTLVICKTDSVRKAFTAKVQPINDKPEAKVLPFTPELSLQLPRLSQVVFNSSQEYLIVCAEEGGGLRVYRTDALAQGQTEAAFSIGTNGISVRGLAPNPAPEYQDYVAVVLSGGQLLLADLAEQKLVDGMNGQIIKDGISCVSWSVRGRQLVAGMGTGVVAQMTANGEVQAEIPRPPQLAGDQHVAAISWLSNDQFFIVYDPTDYNGDVEPSTYYVSRKKKTTEFTFQKMSDPSMPFGTTRTPPHYHIRRLKGFPPSLDDMLIVTNTTTPDIGLITKASVPLVSDDPSTITNVYTTTKPIDGRNAAFPMPMVEGDLIDSTTLGIAVDLSSTDLVPQPIPGDEIDKSPTPLPALVGLTHEGVLTYWYIVYNASIRENKPYPELIAVSGGQQAQAQPAQPPQQAAQPTSFSGFGQGSALGGGMNKPTASAFGQPAFGSPAGGAFGSSSALGSNRSPWASQAGSTNPQSGGSVFGQTSTFGKPSGLGAAASTGSAFGQSGGLGKQQSPWATMGQQKPAEISKPAGSVFGQPASSQSPFASMGNQENKPAASPFGGLGGGSSAASPFAAATQNKSIFGQPSSGQPTGFGGMSTEPSFGSTVTIGSSLGPGSTIGSNQKSIFGTPTQQSFNKANEDEMADVEDEPQQTPAKETEKPAGGLFGLGGGGFKLGSGFKPDETAKENETPKATTGGSSFFGAGFGNALGEQPKPDEPPKSEEPKAQPPPAPMPPEPEIKKEPESPPNQPEPAPLPPSPKPTQQEEPEEAPLPPDPTPAKKASEPEPAPLPPSPKFATPIKPASQDLPQEKDAPLAGSPPIEIQGPQASDVSSRADDATDDEREKAPEAAPLPPDPTPSKPAAPSWGFDDTPSQLLPKAPSPPKSPKPSEGQSFGGLFSHTPAGLPKQAHFPPPTFRPQLSPRSPSPVRSISAPQGPPPGPIQQAPPLAVQSRQPIERSPIEFAAPLPEQTQRRRSPSPVEDPELLEFDADADQVRKQLASALEPTKDLGEFLAHQDYAGPLNTHNKGIPGQIERVYRDVNSMIDTLGLNARTVSNFVTGHQELSLENQHEVTSEDLKREPDEWCLDDLYSLVHIEKYLEDLLEEGRVTHAEEKTNAARALGRDVRKMRNRVIDLRKRIEDTKNPDLRDEFARQPLSAPHAAQRNALRDQFSALQSSLAKLEEALTLLRVKLASARAATSAGSGDSSGTATPTVEAVTNTILKMTAMAQRKSGDIDVLESQLRKLRMSTPRSRQGTPERSALTHSALGRSTRSSREASPFVTPPRGGRSSLMLTRSAGPTPLREGSYGFDYDDDEGDVDTLRMSTRSGLSTRSEGNEKDYWIHITHEEVADYKKDQRRRKKVGKALREAILRKAESAD